MLSGLHCNSTFLGRFSLKLLIIKTFSNLYSGRLDFDRKLNQSHLWELKLRLIAAIKWKVEVILLRCFMSLYKTHYLVPRPSHKNENQENLGTDFTVAYRERYRFFTIHQKIQAIFFELHIVFTIFL